MSANTLVENLNSFLETNDYFVELPPFDSKHNFDWRVRVDVREAISIPSNT